LLRPQGRGARWHDRSARSSLHRSLAPGGHYLMMGPKASSNLEDNIGHPMAPLLYAVSTLHCLTVSLAEGGAGLGTAFGEHTSRSDDGNPTGVLWRWQVTPIPGQRSRIEVTWLGLPRTFWQRALFVKIRRRQISGEVPTSLGALVALLPRPSATAAT
jgi:hypothetical protein